MADVKQGAVPKLTIGIVGSYYDVTISCNAEIATVVLLRWEILQSVTEWIRHASVVGVLAQSWSVLCRLNSVWSRAPAK